MCGITAISRVRDGSSINDPRQFMRLAALAIEQRGKHATGFGWTRQQRPDPSQPATWYWKKKGPAHEVVREAPLEYDMSVAIGHTRWATQGDVKDNRNNHPVVDEGIVLVHNGIINNDAELYRGLDEFYVPKADVDSQVVATLLANAHEFYAEHPTDLLKLIEGSAALAWLDTADRGALHLARLAERPLTLGWTRQGDLVMSSTRQTMQNLESWSNVRIRKIREVDEGTYLRVVDGEIVEERSFKVRRRVYTTGPYRPPAQQKAKVPAVVTTAEVLPFESALKRDARDVQDFWDEVEFDEWGYPIDDLYVDRDPFADQLAEGPEIESRRWDDIDDTDWDNLVPRRGWKEE